MKTTQTEIEIVVRRPFFLAGTIQPKGSRLRVPGGLAAALFESNRAVPAPAAAPEELVPEAAQAPEPEKPEKPGRRRAGSARNEEG